MTRLATATIPNVLPSGLEVTISLAPIVPPAPDRFTTARPLGNFFFIPSATARRTTSASPPAGKPTMAVTAVRIFGPHGNRQRTRDTDEKDPDDTEAHHGPTPFRWGAHSLRFEIDGV